MIVKINCELCFLINLFIHAVNVFDDLSCFRLSYRQRRQSGEQREHNYWLSWGLYSLEKKISISHSLLAIPRLSLDS